MSLTPGPVVTRKKHRPSQPHTLLEQPAQHSACFKQPIKERHCDLWSYSRALCNTSRALWSS